MLQNNTEKIVLKCVLAENGSCTNLYPKNYVGTSVIESSQNFIKHIAKEFNIAEQDIIILRDIDSRELKSGDEDLQSYLKDTKSLFIYSRSKTIEAKDEYEVVGIEQSLSNDDEKQSDNFLPRIFDNEIGKIKDILATEDKAGVFLGILSDFELAKDMIFNLNQSIKSLSRQKSSQTIAKNYTYNYFHERSDSYNKIFNEWDQRLTKFQNLAENIPSNVEKLKNRQVDANLKQDKKYLSEYFDLANLEKSKKGYSNNINTLKNKAAQIKTKVKDSLEALKGIKSTIDNRDEELSLNLNSIRIDYEKVLKDCTLKYKDLKNKENISSKDITDLLDYCKKIKPTLKEKILKVLEEKIEEANKLIRTNGQKIRDFVEFLTKEHQKIKKEIVTSIDAFNGALSTIQIDIRNLGALEKFPKAYDASLSEIRRRDQFLSDFTKLLVFANRVIDEENKMRKQFSDEYLEDIPAEFCPKLTNTFPSLGIDKILNEIQKAKIADLNIRFDPDQYKNIPTHNLLVTYTQHQMHLEGKIKTLEKDIRGYQDRFDTINLQLNEKGLSVPNLKMLLAKNEFQKGLDKCMFDYKQKCEKKLLNYERRIVDLTSIIINKLKKNIKNKAPSKPTNASCTKCEELEYNLILQTSKNESDRNMIDQILETNTELERKFKEEKSKSDDLKIKLEKMQKDVEDRNKLIDKKNLRANELEGEFKAHQKKFDDIVNTLRGENSRLQDVINKFEKNQSDDTSKISNLQKQSEKDKVTIETLLKACEDQSTELANLREILKLHNGENQNQSDLKKHIEGLYHQITGETIPSRLGIESAFVQISEAVKNSFLKVDDIHIGDTIAAIRIPGPSNFYQVIKKSLFTYLIKGDSGASLKQIITGKVKKVDYFSLSSEARKKYPDEEYLLEVELEGIDPINLLS